MRPPLSVQYIISYLPFTSTTSHLFGDLLWRRLMMSLTHHISVPRLLAPRIVYYPVLFTTMEIVMQVMAVFGSSSPKHRCPEWMHFYGTRMHSSRMRTVRCSSRLLGGGLPSWGCLPQGGVCQGGGVCQTPLLWCEWNDWQTGVTRKHSSRMHTIRLPTLCALMDTTRGQYQGEGPQVNKFE